MTFPQKVITFPPKVTFHPQFLQNEFLPQNILIFALSLSKCRESHLRVFFQIHQSARIYALFSSNPPECQDWSWEPLTTASLKRSPWKAFKKLRFSKVSKRWRDWHHHTFKLMQNRQRLLLFDSILRLVKRQMLKEAGQSLQAKLILSMVILGTCLHKFYKGWNLHIT